MTIHCDNDHVASINNSSNITMDNIFFDENEVFMKVRGDRSSDIRLINTDTSAAKMEAEPAEGVPAKTVLRK